MVVGIAVEDVLDGTSCAEWVGVVYAGASDPRVVGLDVVLADGMMETKESAGEDGDQILPKTHEFVSTNDGRGREERSYLLLTRVIDGIKPDTYVAHAWFPT